MKLIRFGEPGKEKPGILGEHEQRFDCSAYFADWDAEFFRNGGMERLAMLLRTGAATLPPVADDVRWGPCVARPGKIVCIGLNYSDHAAESGAEVPAEPLIFMKASSAYSGPYDDILIPRGSSSTDWEVELAIVIGRDTRYLDSEDQSIDAVAGYAVGHDISEREYQKDHCGQWCKGKSCDSFAPLGPTLTPAADVPDPQALDLWLTVNGEKRQNGSTSTMVFGVTKLVHYLSQFMALEAGDIIFTGTPPGVGMGMQPPTYLKAGDVVELGITGLGALKQSCQPA